MIGAIIVWVLFGLIAGAVARLLYPGRQAMGWGATMLLGICGSLLGGAIAYLFRLGIGPYEPGGLILAIVGAVILLSLGFFVPGPRRRI